MPKANNHIAVRTPSTEPPAWVQHCLYFGFTREHLLSLHSVQQTTGLCLISANFFCLMHALNDDVTPDMIYSTIMKLTKDPSALEDLKNRLLNCRSILVSPMREDAIFKNTTEQFQLTQNLFILYNIFLHEERHEKSLPALKRISRASLYNLKEIFQNSEAELLITTYHKNQQLFESFNFTLFKRLSDKTCAPEENAKRVKLS